MTVHNRPIRSISDTIAARPRAHGKFIYLGDEKLYVRGTTYGTFRPAEDGGEYDPKVVDRDFAQMAANGLNAVRTYSVPPRWLLDTAQQHGLYVMVGLPWEQHVTFLDGSKRARSIEQRVRAGVRACAGHPAVLCYAIGNEIPASIVRWHGRRRIENYLKRLYRAAKEEDPEALVTYVNYPSTEYVTLPFVDLFCFNVYLEEQKSLEAYLARLHNLAGNRPVIMAEIGLDSIRNGEEAQARVLDWQVRTTFAAGCAGAFVFAWTDEWYRGGYDVEDWAFGLTDRERQPKPALAAVRRALVEAPFPKDSPSSWPRISVVVCTYNGERTIHECLAGIANLEYPDFEVIVVDDGSTDASAAIAEEYDVRLIRTENRGLSNARNTGMSAATGEIVAYLDDDAYPDPHWLSYLAATFANTPHAGVGGPNIAPSGDGDVAACVDNAPGNPTHILLSDGEAEHVPGCNMAFRRACLEEIGGFDPRFRIAGDDVDVCWRVRERGWTLGFSPAAVVWHHRRDSIRAYWQQQHNYGKSEALLERKWPERHNVVGHLLWTGRIYGNGLTQSLRSPQERVHYGAWGSGLFQSIYASSSGDLWSLPLMLEWCLIIAVLVALTPLGVLWEPLLVALPLLLGFTVGLSVLQAGVSAAKASPSSTTTRSRVARLKLLGLTAFLHLLQPLARLRGRLRHGLTPWRQHGRLSNLSLPGPRTSIIWSERWRASEDWLRSVEGVLRTSGAYVHRGSDYDRWELEVRGGVLGAVRTRMALEEHGGGRQQIRFYTWPRCSLVGLVVSVLFASLSAAAMLDGAWVAAAVLGLAAAALVLRALWECAAAMGVVLEVLKEHAKTDAGSDAPDRSKTRGGE